MFAPTSMFRWTACLTALCAVVLVNADLGAVPPQAAAAQALPANAKFVSIFNGKDLTGWHVDRVPADDVLAPKLFAVQNGELTLDTPGTSDYAWLTYDKELKDFALRLEFVAYQDAKGNCGIQFRDKWTNNKYPRHGFDLASNVPESTGFIWDFKEQWLPHAMKGYRPDNFTPYLPQGWTYKWSTDPDPWNQFEVSAIGSKVRTALNGREIINWDGGAKIEPTGNIAIEVHGKQVFRFKFRNIQLAEF